MKLLFLIPPSEGKASGGKLGTETLSFHFEKPHSIVKLASEKDLKCKEKRFEESQVLNNICLKVRLQPLSPPKEKGFRIEGVKSVKGFRIEDDFCMEKKEFEVLPAISRYNGVMYSAIDYPNMTEKGKDFFDTNFLICSGMYGLLKPQDMIGNYKLPIEAKGLSYFWKEKITQKLNTLEADILVDLLPDSYKKMIDWTYLNAKVLRVEFLQEKNGETKKMTHGVKIVKGKWIKNLCEASFTEVQKVIEEKISKNETTFKIFLEE